MEKYLPILKSCPMFATVREDELLQMLHCLFATKVCCKKGEVILAEGDPAERIGIVLEGKVQTVTCDYYGNRNIISTAMPSMLFCESFACVGAKELPMDVIAAEESVILFVHFNRMIRTCSHNCAHHQQMIYNMMCEVAAKNIQFHEKIEITSKRTTREKLLTYLSKQAKSSGSNSFEIPFDRQELADFLAVDRSGLSAEIGKLRKEGILTAEKSRFTLLDS